MEDIFNAFSKLSNYTQKIESIRNLEDNNYRLKNKCGSCCHWMKTSMCKRENHHKVSCSESKCNDFKMEDWVKKLIKENESKLVDLRS